MVDRQIGHEKQISATLQSLTAHALQSLPSALSLPSLSTKQTEAIRSMTIVAARSRAHVVRESGGKREIIEVVQSEGIGRLYKSLSLLARVHASMFGRSVVDDVDLQIARRVAKDAIPVVRQRIFCHVPGGSDIAQPALHHLTKIPMATLEWNLDELTALGIIEKAPIDYENRYMLSPEVEQHVILAGFNVQS